MEYVSTRNKFTNASGWLLNPNCYVFVKKRYYKSIFKKLDKEDLCNRYADLFNKKILDYIKREAVEKTKTKPVTKWYKDSGVIEFNGISNITTKISIHSKGTCYLNIPNPDNVLKITSHDLNEFGLVSNIDRFFLEDQYIIQPRDTLYVWMGEKGYEVQVYQGLVTAVTENWSNGDYSINISSDSMISIFEDIRFNKRPAAGAVEAGLENPVSKKGWKSGIDYRSFIINHSGITQSDIEKTQEDLYQREDVSSMGDVFAGIDAANILSYIITGYPYSRAFYEIAKNQNADYNTFNEKIINRNAYFHYFVPFEIISADAIGLENTRKSYEQLKAKRARDQLEELYDRLYYAEDPAVIEELEIAIYWAEKKIRNNEEVASQSNNVTQEQYDKDQEKITKKREDIISGNDKEYFIVDSAYSHNTKLIGYQRKTNVNSYLLENDYVSSLSICKNVAEDIDFEFFCDENGNLIFQPPKFNRTPLDILEKSDAKQNFKENNKKSISPVIDQINTANNDIDKKLNTEDVDEGERDALIKQREENNKKKEALTTAAEDTTGAQYEALKIEDMRTHKIGIDEIISFNMVESKPSYNKLDLTIDLPEDLDKIYSASWSLSIGVNYDLWKNYGYIKASKGKPYLVDFQEYGTSFVAAYLGQQFYTILSGTLKIAGNEEIKLSDTVLIEEHDMIFYVDGVTHNYKPGESWITTLHLSFGRKKTEFIPFPFSVMGLIKLSEEVK